jgi:hypothetical protein
MLARTMIAGICCCVAASSALAAPCAGFTDVDDTVVGASFCRNVEWLKNRQVTLGCTSATLYCPSDFVTRLQMAAFMDRLGGALEPLFLESSQSGIFTAVNANSVVCQTPTYLVERHPRVATASAMLYHAAPTVQTVTARLVYSVNGGMTWQAFSDLVSLASNPAFAFATQSPVAAPTALGVGDSARFGIRTGDTFSSPTTTDAGCAITVRIDNRSGSSSPFDAQR